MALTLIGVESNNVDNQQNMSLLVPAGTQDGDIILFFGSCDGIGFDLISGFTVLNDSNTGGSHNNVSGFRVANSEPGSYTVNTKDSLNERGIGILATYRGQDITEPIDQFNVLNGGSDRRARITGVTPALDNSAVSIFVGTEKGHDGNPIIATHASEFTLELDNVNGPPGDNNGSSAAAFLDVIQTIAEEVSGGFNLDLTGTTFWGTHTIVINPLTATSVGDAAGTSFSATSGRIEFEIVGLAEGSAIVSGVGDSIVGSVGQASGVSGVTGAGVASIGAAGAAAGQAEVDGNGSFVGGAIGSAAGEATVTGVGAKRLGALGNAEGFATLFGVGEAEAGTVGFSQGTSEVVGVGDRIETGKMVGSIEGVAVVTGTGGGLGGGASTGVRSGQGRIRRRGGTGRIISSSGGGFVN